MTNYFFYCLISTFLFISCTVRTTTSTSKQVNSTGGVELFGDGLISTALNERDIAISRDGKELFYTLGTFNQKSRVIVQMTNKNGKWTHPVILPWSGGYNDIEPFLSHDNHELYFASTRPIYGEVTRKDYNIWVSKKNGDVWENPVPLDSIINTRKDEYYPSLGRSGNLYFTAAYTDAVGKEDIYFSEIKKSKFSTPKPLDTLINTKFYEFNAYISPGEDTIIYSSFGRKDDIGGGDMYMNIKSNGKWQPVIHFDAPINSTGLDYCPFIDYPRGEFYFTSNRTGNALPSKDFSTFTREALGPLNGSDNIYKAPLHMLKKK